MLAGRSVVGRHTRSHHHSLESAQKSTKLSVSFRLSNLKGVRASWKTPVQFAAVNNKSRPFQFRPTWTFLHRRRSTERDKTCARQPAAPTITSPLRGQLSWTLRVNRIGITLSVGIVPSSSSIVIARARKSVRIENFPNCVLLSSVYPLAVVLPSTTLWIKHIV